MPNCWSYVLYLPAERSIDRQVVDVVLETARDVGYQFKASDKGLHGQNLQLDGTFWGPKDQNDFYVSFSLPHKLNVGISKGLLYERDEAFAKDLEAIFKRLCESLRPSFAYSSDEWSMEFLWTKDFVAQFTHWEKQVLEENQPPALFWLNYFSSRFFDKVGTRSFSKIRHEETVVGTEGRFVQIGDGPPGAGSAVVLDPSGCYAEK